VRNRLIVDARSEQASADRKSLSHHEESSTPSQNGLLNAKDSRRARGHPIPPETSENRLCRAEGMWRRTEGNGETEGLKTAPLREEEET